MGHGIWMLLWYTPLHPIHLKIVASQAMALCGSILLQQHIYPNGKKKKKTHLRVCVCVCVWMNEA